MGPRHPVPSAAERDRRRAVRLEDAVSLVVGVLVVVAAVVSLTVGTAVHDSTVQRARAQATDRAPVTAVLVHDVPVSTDRGGSDGRPATVRWTGHDGREHVGTTVVDLPGPAGAPTRIWTTADDRLVPAPVTAADAVGAAVVSGMLAAVVCGLVVLAVASLLYRWTASRFARAWEREWARVEPLWTGRTRH
ncbi:hypothetical protein [Pseudonocardia spirodelae]|uniref:DUF3592 domain-containing protein n=1 Tax=Pseudonocardia spirodelae TaxID=3133431 RepID=A0ABU8T2H5_9PSEU